MDWVLRETEYLPDRYDFLGNKFCTGNGYLGVRGTLEEDTKERMPAVNLAGIYDRVGDRWRESVNAPNGFFLRLFVNEKPTWLPERPAETHVQALDLRRALQQRRTVWRVGNATVTLTCERFADLAQPHLMGLRCRVETDAEAALTLKTGIDGDVWDINGPHLPELTEWTKNGALFVRGQTEEKKILVQVCERAAASNGGQPVSGEVSQEGKKLLHVWNVRLIPGKAFRLEKLVWVSTSHDGASFQKSGESLEKAFSNGYDAARQEHIRAWEAVWERSQVELEGDDEMRLALHDCIYHLNCIAPRHANSMSIPARGLSGQTYKGAVFWDTEMFMFDYFLYTQPQIARTLLRYRIDTLPGACQKAREYGFEGAFYAWESQEGGLDACSDFNVTDVFTGRPVRTFFRDKQVHISAAMVYAMQNYRKVTGDDTVLAEGGAQMLLECARFYRSLLLQRVGKDCYELHDVVGPDEYHERVNNDAYTNRMAKFVFETAADFLRDLPKKEPRLAATLAETYDLEELLRSFTDCAQHLYQPQPDPETGVIEQFDGYFHLEDASLATVRSRLKDPREYWGGSHGVAGPTQINKQADVVAMLSLFPRDWPERVLAANLAYYGPRTEHGSSLSACMFALCACLTGKPDQAYPFFTKSATADLKPGTKQWAGKIYIGGTHPAASGGAWMVAVHGFAGLKTDGGRVTAHAELPHDWERLSFQVQVRGEWYRITAVPGSAVVEKSPSAGRAD